MDDSLFWGAHTNNVMRLVSKQCAMYWVSALFDVGTSDLVIFLCVRHQEWI